MNLNATLFAQFVVFIILALFTAKAVWPPLMKVLDERAKKIAEGLAAADRSKQEMIAIEKHVLKEMQKVQVESQRQLSEVGIKAQQLTEELKVSAEARAMEIIERAKVDAQSEIQRIREELRKEVAALAVKGAEQILRREIDSSIHADLLKQLAAEL
ncbi:MAG: F0F1 ATP synthase subunit B [Burkholderiaceae bacterium]|nr:F0F1 ATP synthase subunit B [Burkholderiaceae bacterium]